MLFTILMAYMAVSGTSCSASRVVLVHPAEHQLIRIGPNVRGRVYFYNGNDWELSGNTVDIPEGWYAGYVSPAGEASNKSQLMDQSEAP